MTFVIGARYRPLLEAPLRVLGKSVFWLPDNPAVDPRLAGHADLAVLRLGKDRVCVPEGADTHFVNYLTNRGYPIVYAGKQGAVYPQDVGLCVCATGKYTICNSKTVDPAIASCLTGVRIDVSQGYTKCAVSVVSDEAIITADNAVASRAAEAGMDVLRIAPGHVVLEGFDYGFIGGASFLLDKQTMAFTGSIEDHPDKARIGRFLQKHGVTPVFLTERPIFDIGGAVAL